MSWVKLDDGFFGHTKVRGLSKDARLLYIAGLTYVARCLTDGILDAQAVRESKAAVDAGDDAVKELVSAGLWGETGSGHIVHGYLDCNPTAEEVLARREARRLAGQAGGQASAQAKRSANRQTKGQRISNPVPVPVPLTRIPRTPNPIESADALLANTAFIEELRARYEGLDFDYEFKKWADHVSTRPPKGNWKNSLRNWLEKAVEYQAPRLNGVDVEAQFFADRYKRLKVGGTQ